MADEDRRPPPPPNWKEDAAAQNQSEGVRIIREVSEDEPPLRFAPSGESEAGALPHWTEPATGEVPRLLFDDTSEVDNDLDVWSSITSSPRWRDNAVDWEDGGDVSRFGDEHTRIGALDSGRPDEAAVVEEPTTTQPAVTSIRTRGPRSTGTPGRTNGPLLDANLGGTSGRDMPMAVAVGAALGVVALGLFKVGPGAAMVLVTAVLAVATAEFYAAMRKVGYHPATLLGIVATASLALACYWQGEVAFPMVIALTIASSLLWFLFAGEGTRPVPNIAATLAGFGYVGVLGSFAALLLRLPNGVGFLLGAILGTVAYDVGGLFVGSSAGRSRLAPAISPNKTYEGLVGGMIAALVISLAVSFRFTPWDSLTDAWRLGAIIAIAAPLGDLSESMIKRDLGVKDMGSILPGHGGLLDRFDALLFVLPAVYYLARQTMF